MTKYRLLPVALSTFFLLAFFATFFPACGKGMPTPSFVYHEDGLLRVNNDFQQRLVLFSGAPSRETYIGGVPGKTNDFRLNVPAGEWLITAVKVEEYMMTRTNAEAIPVSWSGAVVIEDSPAAITIDSLFSGQGRVLFHNKTDGFVQVRRGSFTGTNVAALAPNSSRIQHLPYWDFELYPVRLDWVRGEGAFRETWLSNAANLLGLYPDRMEEMTIEE